MFVVFHLFYLKNNDLCSIRVLANGQNCFHLRLRETLSCTNTVFSLSVLQLVGTRGWLHNFVTKRNFRTRTGVQVSLWFTDLIPWLHISKWSGLDYVKVLFSFIFGNFYGLCSNTLISTLLPIFLTGLAIKILFDAGLTLSIPRSTLFRVILPPRQF